MIVAVSELVQSAGVTALGAIGVAMIGGMITLIVRNDRGHGRVAGDLVELNRTVTRQGNIIADVARDMSTATGAIALLVEGDARRHEENVKAVEALRRDASARDDHLEARLNLIDGKLENIGGQS